MKKYKLIKEFPGSPKLGTINTNDQLSWKGEDYPEFWQEIVEKDYEILSFKTNRNIFTKDKNNIFRSINVNDSADCINIRTESYMLTSSETYKIHQVKRLSDGEIFTIGEYVDSTISDLGRPVEITSFKIINDKLTFGLRDLGYYPLSTIILPKKPLFTTEDGVDIFENDSYYVATKEFYISQHVKANYGSGTSLTAKYFSTKEKAEEYILMNKPCLSLNDVEKAFKKRRTTHTILGELKEIVNTKING